MNNFEIITKLGDGAYSKVYKVRRKEDKKIYALKKVKLLNLTIKEKQNSLNEVRILASIKSPFVISYKEAFMEEDKDKNQFLCIVMEYADKGDLMQKINLFKKKKLSFEETDIWKIFIQMTRGLKSLHDLKILHRDFKSANIFLFSDGIVKIGDLNVSKVIYKGLGYTQTGTPYYASPEVWSQEPYDTKSDIWSLACITYEMLELQPPFRADSFDALYKKVIKGKFGKINKKYSKDISDLLNKLFKVDPKERPSCNEILKMDIVQKRIEFFKAQAGFENVDIDDESLLLKTIKIPQNILLLGDRLPKANYENDFYKNNNHNNENLRNSTKIAETAILTLPNINCKTLIKSTNNDAKKSISINGINNNESNNYNNYNNEKKISVIQRTASKPDKLKINLNNNNNNNKFNGKNIYIKHQSPQNMTLKIKGSGGINRNLIDSLKLYLPDKKLSKIFTNRKYLPKIANKKKK